MRAITTFTLAALFLISCSDINDKSDAYGNFEAVETIISSEVNGKILSFSTYEGQKLKAGDTVGLIDTVQLYLKKQQTYAQKKTISTKIQNVLAQIAVQKEQKKKLLFEKDRVERLLKDGAATQKQMDDLNSQIDVVDKQISAIEIQNSTTLNEMEIYTQQIAQIQDQLDRSTIINPLTGTVLETYIEPHEMAMAGKALYKIANMDELKLRVYISGAQLSEVKIGQEVEVLIDSGEETFSKLKGKISWVSDQAEFTPKIIQTKKERVNLVYAMVVLVKNDGTLKIGMPGEINFKMSE